MASVERLGGIAVSPAIRRILAGMDRPSPTLADIPTGDTRPVKKLPQKSGRFFNRHGPGSREKEEKYLAQRRLRGIGDALLGGADLANMVINAGIADFNLLTGGLGSKRDVELSMPSQDAANFLTDITGTKIIPDEEVSPEVRQEGANQRAYMGMIPTGAEDVIPSGAAVQGILHGVPNLFKKPALEDLAKGVDPDKVWHDWQWELNAAGQPWTETTGKPRLRTDLEEQQSGFLPPKTSDFEAQPVDPNQLPLFTEEDLDLGGRRTTGGRFPAHYEYEPYSIPGPRVPEKHGRPKATVSSFVENPQLYEQPGLEFLGGLPMNLQKGAFSTEPNAAGLYYRPDPGAPAAPRGRIAVTTKGGATLPVVQHELTHAAAQKFGLPQGFNPRHGEAASHGLRQRSIIDANKQAYDEAWQMQNDAYHKASDELYDRTGETLRLGDFKRQWAKENPMLQKIIDENAYLADFEGMSEPSLAYHTSMGEVSARNSALRDTGWYKPRQLREKRPGRTEDVPRHLQWTENEATGDIINPSASVEDPLKPRPVGGLGSVKKAGPMNVEVPVGSVKDVTGPSTPGGLGGSSKPKGPMNVEVPSGSTVDQTDTAPAMGVKGSVKGSVKSKASNTEIPVSSVTNPAAPQGLGIRAYHGSPHSFEEFDISKIGTGEGAQAYGHGLYFAENEGVAKSYRDTLSNRDASGYATAHLNAQNLVAKLNGDADYAAEVLRDQISAVGPDDANFQRLQDTLKFVEDGGYAKPLPEAGHMYEVDIAADPEAFLDWDKPLSEQPNITEALKKQGLFTGERQFDDWNAHIGPGGVYVNPNDPAQRAYIAAQQEMGAGPASEAFQKAGIPGIRYLDQGSRATSGGELLGVEKTPQGWQAKIKVDNRMGVDFQAPAQMFTTSKPYATEAEARQWADSKINTGSRNYVVFDPKLISIVKKYGLAAAIASGVITEEMGRQMQQQGEI